MQFYRASVGARTPLYIGSAARALVHFRKWCTYEINVMEIIRVSSCGTVRRCQKRIQRILSSGHRDARRYPAPYLYVEAKYRQKHSLVSLMQDTWTKADVERKIPVIVLKEKDQRGCLIVIDSNDLDRLAKAGRYDDLPLFAGTGGV